jgi:hypothetical protein
MAVASTRRGLVLPEGRPPTLASYELPARGTGPLEAVGKILPSSGLCLRLWSPLHTATVALQGVNQ